MKPTKYASLILSILVTFCGFFTSCNQQEELESSKKSKTIQDQQWPASISFSDTDSSFNVHLSKPFGNLQYSNPEIIQTQLGQARYTVFANDADKELKLFISKSQYNKEALAKRTSNEILEMSATAFIHDLQGRTSLSMPITKHSTSQKFHGLRVFYAFPLQQKDSLFGCSEFFVSGSTVFHTCIITKQKQLFDTSKDIGLIFTSFMPLDNQAR